MTWTTPATNVSTGSIATSGITRATAGFQPSACWATGCNGTGWGQPGVPWIGGRPDFQSTFRKVFRVADLMRYVGADVYHRDWGWWDRAGDWNGPDFRATGNYLRKSGMGQLIYAFLYTVDKKSRVAQDHPDWLLGNTLDMSRPEVVAFMDQSTRPVCRALG